MRIRNQAIQLSPTDLSNHLGCRHLTTLNREDAEGRRNAPHFHDPALEALQERGQKHEDAYVEHLRASGKDVLTLERDTTIDDAVDAMRAGVDVIVQAVLTNERWNGRADILIRVEKPSQLGAWSYEVQDTKLALNTKSGTVLQLAVYCDVVAEIQGVTPEHFYVVKPGAPFEIETFRYDDFKAYYNRVKKNLIDVIAQNLKDTYPDPVEQCGVCRWWKICDKKRHDDDHLSLVANIRKTHIGELNKHQIQTLEQFAGQDQPLPGKPEHGSLESFQKVHRQAKIQQRGKGLEVPLHEILPVTENRGFNVLPEPNEGDVYFDFEGDPFYPDGGIEYLFGIVFRVNGELKYKSWWAFTRAEERIVFGQFMDFMMDHWKAYPGMHIYHYSPYEPSALKRLAARHAAHEDDIREMLIKELFVDLYSVAKQGLVASVENYSIKSLEKLPGFVRKCALELAGPARRLLEYILEFKEPSLLTDETKQVVADYNEDDCRATEALHVWLEKERSEIENLSRPVLKREEEEAKKSDAAELRNALYERIREMIQEMPDHDIKKSWELLANMVHYHYREDKNHHWLFYTNHKKEPDELWDEKTTLIGLTRHERMPKGKGEKKPRYRYTFLQQPVGLKSEARLFDLDGSADKAVATLEAIDLVKCEAIISHPEGITLANVHANGSISTIYELQKGLHALIQHFEANGLETRSKFNAARDLLLKSGPNIIGKAPDAPIIINEDKSDDDKWVAQLIEAALHLDDSVLPIQGPPGTGKTHTGSKIILGLLKAGKTVGVTAVSHKVIQGVMTKVNEFADKAGIAESLKFVHKKVAAEKDPKWIEHINNNAKVIDLVQPMTLVGATVYMWSRPEAVEKLDYLVVDEAGQMSLANVLAAARCAKNLILLGDPQQLEQPQQGVHPEGADVAALAHLLEGDRKTIESHKGIFLGTTYRLHPAVCDFTSEVYYEKRLHSVPGAERMSIHGETRFAGAGLFYEPVIHSGNQTKSDEEVDAIADIVQELLSKASWTNSKGETLQIGTEDIMIVAPFNDQVNALHARLPELNIGSVDKFQGGEAAIVIYSVTTSSAADAPRGMEFLYSPNRLNVATSRAMCAVILVGTEKVFEAECRTIEQMKWVNGFCRYREMSKEQ